MTNFNIQIISDTVCPWCYVGLRRLSRAIATHKSIHPADTFTLTWHAYYLRPDNPPYPGLDKREYYISRFGEDGFSQISNKLGEVGRQEGVAFKFIGKLGNTRDSHRVIWYAGKKEREAGAPAATEPGVVGGLQTKVVENLFKAYFEEGGNITDQKMLLEAAVLAGLDRGEVERLLKSDDGGQEVDLEAAQAQRQLVTGVPYYTIQGQYAIGGAEDPSAFLQAFEQAKQNS
ncbi:DSBA-like thioredoxin domain-containing protein [Aspergillus pseudotamarii]|uniref:DSBA-like thioredoxin domain-containing protein n=1 Tax=Aspergillus pseudotamarii TaxID=132259 RepID=A0A5N6SJV3_ASPPS|nr:DSBA-like thioredoxin domain-containing protein [Aspergillus pseudotamarii]KAE8134040.1 DSBA-like thioredoxin domain-containing protein [Aspergillus pseudotamarii]